MSGAPLARAAVPVLLAGAVTAQGCNVVLDIPDREATEGVECEDQDCVCVAPQDDCDGNPSNGCESNLETSGDHCGVCGQSCLGEPCVDGVCQPRRLTALGELGLEKFVTPVDLPQMVVFDGYIYWSSAGTAFGSFAQITQVTPPGIFRMPVDAREEKIGVPLVDDADGGRFAENDGRLYASSGFTEPGFIVGFDEGDADAVYHHREPDPDPMETARRITHLASRDGTLLAAASTFEPMTSPRSELVVFADDTPETMSWTLPKVTAMAANADTLFIAPLLFDAEGVGQFTIRQARNLDAEPSQGFPPHKGSIAELIVLDDIVYYACIECRDDVAVGLVKKDAIMRWRPGKGPPELFASAKDVTGLALDDDYVYWAENLGAVKAQRRDSDESQTLFTSENGGMAGLALDEEALYFRDADAVYRLAKPVP